MFSDDEKQLIIEEGKFLLDLGYSVNMEDKRMVRFFSPMYDIVIGSEFDYIPMEIFSKMRNEWYNFGWILKVMFNTQVPRGGRIEQIIYQMRTLNNMYKVVLNDALLSEYEDRADS